MEELYNRKNKQCAIYIRVSSERQVQGYSLEGQKRFLKEWAEFEGMNVVEIYVEPGKSGKSISGREVFQRMLSDISTGQINIAYILVFKLSRFGRNAKDILNSLTYIQKYGVNLICKEDSLDSSTAMGKMMITILGAVAEMERDNILTQTMLGREAKARLGGWNGGFACFGYSLINGKLEKKEDEAPIVELIFKKFVEENMGYSTIAGYLNRQGVPRLPSKNSHGRKFTDWDINQVKRILKNPVYTGRVAFGRTRLEKVPGTENEYRRVKADNFILSDEVSHEPIISDEMFEKVQAKLNVAASKGNPAVSRSTKHLLSGILKCPMCGSSMYADIVQWARKDGTCHRKVNYQCGHYAKSKYGQCKKNSIFAGWIEEEVIAYTKMLVRNPMFMEDIQSKIGQKVDVSEIDIEIKNFKKKIISLDRSKNRLEQDIDSIFEDDKNAERKRRDMNKRLDKIYEEIYSIEDQIGDCEQRRQAVKHQQLTKESIYQLLLVFEKLFDKMNREEKRKIIESLIAEVHLHPKETWKEGKNPVKEIKYTFPVSQEVIHELRDTLSTVETVCLLTKIK